MYLNDRYQDLSNKYQLLASVCPSISAHTEQWYHTYLFNDKKSSPVATEYFMCYIEEKI